MGAETFAKTEPADTAASVPGAGMAGFPSLASQAQRGTLGNPLPRSPSDRGNLTAREGAGDVVSCRVVLGDDHQQVSTLHLGDPVDRQTGHGAAHRRRNRGLHLHGLDGGDCCAGLDNVAHGDLD